MRVLILLAGLILCLPCWAQNQVQDQNQIQYQDRLPIGERWQLLPEASADWEAKKVDSSALEWQPSRWKSPNLGFKSDPYWMRIVINPGELTPGFWRLWIHNSLLSDVSFYVFENDVLVEQQQDGLWHRLTERANGFRYPAFQFRARADREYRIYLRVQSETALQVPAELVSESLFAQTKARDDLVLGLFAGVLLAMMLYNLVLYFTLRELSFLLYVGHVGALLLFVASWQGVGATYIWPDLIGLQSFSIALATFLVIGFSTWFCGVFLDLTRENFPLLRLFWGVRNLSFAGALVTPALPPSWTIVASSLLSVPAVLLVINAIIMRAPLRQRPTRLFALGWALYVTGAFMMALNKFGWIEVSDASENLLLWSSVFDMMLLCIALGDRFHARREAALQQQQQTVDSADSKLESIRDKQRREQAIHQGLVQAIIGQEDYARQLELRLRERGRELELLQQQLLHAGENDGLTGLKNRRYFSDRLFEETERHRHLGTHFSVLVIDVDRFRQINESHGHLAGDECLRQIADILRQRLRRPADILCRIGGEKFAVLLPDTSGDGAISLAEIIRDRVATCPMLCAGQRIMATVSIGVSEVSGQQSAYAEWILIQADRAVQRAKADGRNCVALAG